MEILQEERHHGSRSGAGELLTIFHKNKREADETEKRKDAKERQDLIGLFRNFHQSFTDKLFKFRLIFKPSPLLLMAGENSLFVVFCIKIVCWKRDVTVSFFISEQLKRFSQCDDLRCVTRLITESPSFPGYSFSILSQLSESQSMHRFKIG